MFPSFSLSEFKNILFLSFDIIACKVKFLEYANNCILFSKLAFKLLANQN